MTYYSESLKINTGYNLGNPHCLRRLLLLFIAVRLLFICVSPVVKCRTGEREIPGSSPDRCNFRFFFLFSLLSAF